MKLAEDAAAADSAHTTATGAYAQPVKKAKIVTVPSNDETLSSGSGSNRLNSSCAVVTHTSSLAAAVAADRSDQQTTITNYIPNLTTRRSGGQVRPLHPRTWVPPILDVDDAFQMNTTPFDSFDETIDSSTLNAIETIERNMMEIEN